MSQISEYQLYQQPIAENSSSNNLKPSKTFFSNLKPGQLVEKREEFAISLRKSKKKQILDKRRTILGTKNIYGDVQNPIDLTQDLIKLKCFLKSLTKFDLNEDYRLCL